MFGFGNDTRTEQEKQDHVERNMYIPAALSRTLGTTDPQKINEIWHKYMPEITNAILNTQKYVVQTHDNQHIIGKCMENHFGQTEEKMDEQHSELMTEIRDLKQQNKDLQEKYNAMVERMARYIEKENGKGR